MKTYNIQIRVDRHYFEMSMGADTPALFADEIRKLVKEYFDDVINPNPNLTNYYDKNGRRVKLGDWICFLWWVPTSSGLQRECYYYGRILKRRGKLVFKYRDDFSKPGKGFHERRLDTLNFDSTCDWEITNDSITHYGGYMPASK